MFELRIWDTGNLYNFPYLPATVVVVIPLLWLVLWLSVPTVISSIPTHSSESLDSIENMEDSLESLVFLGLVSLFFPSMNLFHLVFTRAWNSFLVIPWVALCFLFLNPTRVPQSSVFWVHNGPPLTLQNTLYLSYQSSSESESFLFLLLPLDLGFSWEIF